MVACLALLIVAEYVRYYRLPPVGPAMHVAMSHFTDSKDKGSAILTHIYLLLGCLLPILFSTNSNLYILSSGTILLGAGDSGASVFGTRFGKTYWLSESKKSLEGSSAAFIMMLIFLFFYNQLQFFPIFSTLLAIACEGLTDQIDNLYLPIFYLSILLGFCHS